LIPKALLQAVPHTGEVGQAIITVARFRQVDHMVGDRPLRLLSESAKVRTVTLVDSIPGGGANRGPQLANARRR
jgi:hypothetical protein